MAENTEKRLLVLAEIGALIFGFFAICHFNIGANSNQQWRNQEFEKRGQMLYVAIARGYLF